MVASDCKRSGDSGSSWEHLDVLLFLPSLLPPSLLPVLPLRLLLLLYCSVTTARTQILLVKNVISKLGFDTKGVTGCASLSPAMRRRPVF